MFIFQWFGIFNDAYWNGFGDGCALAGILGGLLHVIELLFRIIGIFAKIREEMRLAAGNICTECTMSDYDAAAKQTAIFRHQIRRDILPADFTEYLDCRTEQILDALEKGNIDSAGNLSAELVNVIADVNLHEVRFAFKHPLKAIRMLHD